jgi:hypothetical protein
LLLEHNLQALGIILTLCGWAINPIWHSKRNVAEVLSLTTAWGAVNGGRGLRNASITGGERANCLRSTFCGPFKIPLRAPSEKRETDSPTSLFVKEGRGDFAA